MPRMIPNSQSSILWINDVSRLVPDLKNKGANAHQPLDIIGQSGKRIHYYERNSLENHNECIGPKTDGPLSFPLSILLSPWTRLMDISQ